MKRKDLFFVSLFAAGFLVSAVIMADVGEAEAENAKETTEQANAIESEQNVYETESVIETTVEEEESAPLQEEESAPLQFETVEYDYFDDALFIGDSRTVGIMEYGNLENATFLADSGMSVFALEKKKVNVPGLGKVTFKEVLEKGSYGKIYLMLGLNELGYSFESVARKYQETIEQIRQYQEEAILFVCANMHVTQEQSEKDDIYNNANINKVNELISSLADGEKIFYIDINEVFDDENGNLSTEYTSDDSHVYGRYYADWVDWLCTKGIKIPEK